MEILVAILIHLGVPFLGLQFYFHLKKHLHQKQIHGLSDIPLFLVFVSYGGWVMVLLTGLFWYWSGMATIGLAYLIFVAPILSGYLAWRLYGQRNYSQFHFNLFIACALYPILPVTVLVLAKF